MPINYQDYYDQMDNMGGAGPAPAAGRVETPQEKMRRMQAEARNGPPAGGLGDMMQQSAPKQVNYNPQALEDLQRLYRNYEAQGNQRGMMEVQQKIRFLTTGQR